MEKTLTAIVLSLTLLVFGCDRSSVYPDAVVERQGITYLINSKTPFSGEIVTLYPGLDSDAKLGQTLSRIQYEDGKRNGEAVYFHGNGQLEAEGDYRNGGQNGPWLSYHKNGQLGAEGDYRNGERNGPWLSYHNSGGVYRKLTYQNGKANGPYVEYNENGQVFAKGTYQNGRVKGPYAEYHENGQLHFKGTYLYQGSWDGLYVEYRKDGQLVEKSTYQSGQYGQHGAGERNGPYVKYTYHDNGKLSTKREGVYDSLQRCFNGSYVRYDKTGKLFEKGTYNCER